MLHCSVDKNILNTISSPYEFKINQEHSWFYTIPSISFMVLIQTTTTYFGTVKKIKKRESVKDTTLQGPSSADPVSYSINQSHITGWRATAMCIVSTTPKSR